MQQIRGWNIRGLCNWIRHSIKRKLFVRLWIHWAKFEVAIIVFLYVCVFLCSNKNSLTILREESIDIDGVLTKFIWFCLIFIFESTVDIVYKVPARVHMKYIGRSIIYYDTGYCDWIDIAIKKWNFGTVYIYSDERRENSRKFSGKPPNFVGVIFLCLYCITTWTTKIKVLLKL